MSLPWFFGMKISDLFYVNNSTNKSFNWAHLNNLFHLYKCNTLFGTFLAAYSIAIFLFEII